MLRFSVPGEPQGKGRPRLGTVNGHARVFTPAKTRSYEALVALAAEQAMGGAVPYERAVPLRCRIEATFSVPASWSRPKRVQALEHKLRPTKKPDGDNILKVMDALNGVVWVDDVSVVEWVVVKRYGPVPGLTVEVEPA